MTFSHIFFCILLLTAPISLFQRPSCSPKQLTSRFFMDFGFYWWETIWAVLFVLERLCWKNDNVTMNWNSCNTTVRITTKSNSKKLAVIVKWHFPMSSWFLYWSAVSQGIPCKIQDLWWHSMALSQHRHSWESDLSTKTICTTKAAPWQQMLFLSFSPASWFQEPFEEMQWETDPTMRGRHLNSSSTQSSTCVPPSHWVRKQQHKKAETNMNKSYVNVFTNSLSKIYQTA